MADTLFEANSEQRASRLMNIRHIRMKNRLLSALVVALVAASLLSAVRGGFDTGPFLVFTGGSFTLVVAWQVFCSRESLASIESALRCLPYASAFRYALVFGALVVLALWSGPLITSGGFGGWLIALLVALLSSAVVCPLAPRLPILFGVLCGGCIAFSLAVQNSRLYSLNRDIQWSYAFSDPGTLLLIWCIAAALSLLISLPVYIHRRAA